MIMNKIEHVVLLMMENRSFDSMLGWLYEKGRPAKNVPELKPQERPYEGLQGLNLQDYENVDATGTIKVSPIRGAKGLNVPNIAPGETFAQVTTQLSMIEMTMEGVALAGGLVVGPGVGTPDQQRRNLLWFLQTYTNQGFVYFNSLKDNDLIGMGAVVAFLRATGIRDDSALKNMSVDQQLNILISELVNKTGMSGDKLKGMSRQELVQLGLEWFANFPGNQGSGTRVTPTMKGYVRDFTNLLRHHKYEKGDVERYAEQVMQSYTPDQLPVLNGLAEHYAVCDMWFSSVPSQTNPNRAFAFCGTSMGLVDNGFLEEDPRRVAIEEFVGYKIGDDRFNAKTILNALEDDGKTTWMVYRQSGYLQNNIFKAVDAIKRVVPNTTLDYLRELSSSEVVSDYTHRLFPEILKIKNADSHFAKLDAFYLAAGNGRLPNFTYIEPEWTIGESGTGRRPGGMKEQLKSVLFHQGHDYHPPGNLDAGENLVKRIYNSLISNRAAWEKTLLIITFDEPIGSFDHIPPPAAIPPWGEGKEPPFKRERDFNFDRYGGRVPAILVSPLVQKGTVFRSTTSVPFDHTSLIATILKWRRLENRIPDFGERTKQAPTFDNIVSLSTPRTDEKDVRFLRISHKVGEPVRFYDRFYLKDAMGKYITGFREDAVFPGSFFSEDPSFSEYFPIQSLSYPSEFYLQNANNRPHSGEISTGGGTEVRLIATDYGLGSYNVLGAWKDSRDCYYFNDYMEGDNSKKETWIISKADPFTIEMTTRGVLLAGQWRTEAELSGMSAEDKRNALIVMLVENSNGDVGYFQGFPRGQDNDNIDLVGKGALVVFLLRAWLRDDAALKKMGDVDQRNALIEAIIKHTGSFWPETQLKGMSNQELVQKGLEWFNSRLRFGDKVFIQNKHFAGERLAPDSWFHDYLTTNKGDAYWTVVPILDEIPGPDSINTNNPYYLKHANSGRYVTQVYKEPATWWPTLGGRDRRVKLGINLGFASLHLSDGMPLGFVSSDEDLYYSGKRCDALVAFKGNKYLYYYYRDCPRENRTWMISLRTGSGFVKSGSRVRLVNEAFGQFMAPKNGYLTTVTQYTTDCDWMLEKA